MERTEPRSNLDAAIQLVAREFRKRYGEPIGTFRAPGRVNLIGEHTDYNDGFVMPAALAFYTYVAPGPSNDRTVSVYSIDLDETCNFELDSLERGTTGSWVDYVRGVAAVMLSQGIPVRGANLVVKGEVPIGAGLSSSASIEVATAFALLAVAGVSLDRREIASICQRAEHEFAGTQCGIMDQFISCYGQENHALMLDCRSLEYELLAIDSRVRIVVCNTMVKHKLAGGEYNRRRANCEAGVDYLRQFLPEIHALRDVTLQHLAEYCSRMPDVTYRRCRHVISENARVLEAAVALKQNDLGRFGALMGGSHASLRDDYEVSCKELDLMVELARKCRGVYGARMTGGGFGGCAVSLVDTDAIDEFKATVTREYPDATGLHPEIYVCTAAGGAGEVTEPGT